MPVAPHGINFQSHIKMKRLILLISFISFAGFLQAQKYRVIYNTDSIISVQEDDPNSTTVTFTGNYVMVAELEKAKVALETMGYNTYEIDSLIQLSPVPWHITERPIRMKITDKGVANLVHKAPQLYNIFLEKNIPVIRNDTTGISFVYFLTLTNEEKVALRSFGGELQYNY